MTVVEISRSISPREKARHDRLLFRAFHAAVEQAETVGGKFSRGKAAVEGGRGGGFLLPLLNERADKVALQPRVEMLFDIGIGARAFIAADGKGGDRLPPGRQLVQHRDVEIAVEDQRQCAGNRGGGHHEPMGRAALGGQRRALTDAEAVLLICNDQSE